MSRAPEGYSQWFIGAVGRAVDDAWLAMMRDPCAGPWHVYYRPHGLQIVIAIASPGEGWTCDAKVPTDREKGQLHRWLLDHAARLPLLPKGKS